VAGCCERDNKPSGSIKDKGKGKVIPVLQLSTSPWRRIGEWRYSSSHSLTSALGGGEWGGEFTDQLSDC